MVEYTCEKCKKVFSQKSHFTSHTLRKTPCISEEMIRQRILKETSVRESPKIKVVDLFSGAGGLTYGFARPEYEIMFGVEHDTHAARTYSENFNHPLLNEDIKAIDAIKLKERYGNADVVIGGPPCQGFSMAGKRNTNDPRNSLFMEYMRFVNVFKPKYFVMENVPGILTMKTSESKDLVIEIIRKEVESIGYKLKWKILLASDYGVPQNRRRVIFLGWRSDCLEPNHPEPTHTKETHVCMRDVLIPRDDVPAKYYMSERMIEGFKKRKEKNQKSGNGFGAQFVDLDRPCYTISARYYKDGSDALVKYSETEIRRLTEKEAARVQSFPDSFVFPCSSVQTYKQIGNAVACKLAQAIAAALIGSLRGGGGSGEI